ncbi:uncharacterized protein LOC129229902 [Uloborus diversus]|uniref:uncharacterized protein LOC129229902 n=1 Tax=Uloborus diversus TaxID=327109 RepID=UPI0024094636|nr:uncharacterized protein LOC129229902 [Uloborus diversus]
MMEKSKVAVDESANVDYRNDSNSIVSLPPAYDKPVSTTLKVARILSLTLVAVTTIVGIMVLVGIYIHQGKQCSCGEVDAASSMSQQPLSSARIDRMDHGPTYTTGDQEQGGEKVTVNKNLPRPLKLELDAALGTILKDPKNKKAEVNCVAETRKASQVITQDPKMLMTPFGNFSTDPKTVHLMGERMVLSCISAVKPSKKSSKTKKAAAKLSTMLPRPRRSTKEMCSCNCDC